MQIISELEGIPQAGRGPNHQPRNTRTTRKGTRTSAIFFRVILCVSWFKKFFPVQETVNKSKAMLKAVALAETFAKAL